jgi:hypothetical protein
MATISISVSTEHGSTITVDPYSYGILEIKVETNLRPIHGYIDPIPYDSCAVSFHGSPDALRDLVAKMQAALPAEVDPRDEEEAIFDRAVAAAPSVEVCQ